MRGIKAKLIRRLAEMQSVGQPKREYQWMNKRVPRIDPETGKTMVKTNDKGEKGIVYTVVYCVRLDPKCTRAVYQRLKRVHG